LLRWIDRYEDLVDRTPELRGNGLEPQSFASLLTGDRPRTSGKNSFRGLSPIMRRSLPAPSASILSLSNRPNLICSLPTSSAAITTTETPCSAALWNCRLSGNLGRQFPLRTLRFRRMLPPARTTAGGNCHSARRPLVPRQLLEIHIAPREHHAHRADLLGQFSE
jgi:hypothetical protein